MSIPELNKVTKLQDECQNSHSIKQEKPDNAPDMDLVEKETVTPGPVTTSKSKDTVVIDINIESSKDAPHDLAVWTQFGPTYRPLTPEYPYGLEVFVHPQPKTAQGAYPTAPPGRGRGGFGYPGRKQGHAYPGGGSPVGRQTGQGYTQGGGGQGKGGGQAPAQEEEDEEGDEDQEEEEQGWVYTPEKKNGWVFKVLALVFVMCSVTTIGILVMESTLGDIFDENYAGVGVGFVAMIVLMITLVFQTRKIGIEPPAAVVILILSVPCVICMGTAITVFADCIVIILTFFAMAVSVGILMLLATTKFDFNSCWMYALFPFINIGLLSSLIVFCLFLLEIEMETLEFLVFLVALIQSFVFVFLLQRALGGAYAVYGDAIYAYIATLLFTSIVYIALLLLILCSKSKRRRRRRRIFF